MSQESVRWFYRRPNGAEDGPFERESLVALLAAGVLCDKTLVKKAESEEWRPISELFGDSADGSPPASSIDRPTYLERVVEAGGESTHPWRRYFAKLIDLSTLGLYAWVGVMFGLGFALAAIDAGSVIRFLEKPIVNGVTALIVWTPLDALCLSAFGNTPGRWLFGIRVRTSDGGNLSFPVAFRRSILVSGVGMGMSIVPLALIGAAFAYHRLRTKGETFWDAATESVVTHSEWGVWRAIVCSLAVLFAVAIILFVGVQAFDAWPVETTMHKGRTTTRVVGGAV